MRVLSTILLSLAVACGGPPQDEVNDGGPARVVTSFYPSAYLAARVGGELVRVECPLPADADALWWRPDASTLRDMSKADLIVLHGAGMDAWREQVSLPLGRLVVTCAGLGEHLLEFGDAITHSHTGGDDHTHTGADPHVWMDPLLLQAQARAVHAGLMRVLPEESGAALDQGLAALLSDLDGLDQAWKDLGALPAGESLYTNHPAYDYLARRYGWSLVNLDLDPQQVPAPEVLEAIGASLATNPGRYLMWESPPSAEVVAALRAATGLESTVVSPCEVQAPGLDYMARQLSNVEALRAAFE